MGLGVEVMGLGVDVVTKVQFGDRVPMEPFCILTEVNMKTYKCDNIA